MYSSLVLLYSLSRYAEFFLNKKERLLVLQVTYDFILKHSKVFFRRLKKTALVFQLKCISLFKCGGESCNLWRRTKLPQ